MGLWHQTHSLSDALVGYVAGALVGSVAGALAGAMVRSLGPPFLLH